MKKKLFWRVGVPLLVLMLVFVAVVVFLRPVPYKSRLVVDSKMFLVDVVDTDALLEKGLSNRVPLLADEGMFFDLGSSDRHGFWMKDMLFSIDIIWIDANWRVVHIEKSVSPETYPKIFYPSLPASYVLEISAGASDEIGLKLGDMVTLLPKS